MSNVLRSRPNMAASRYMRHLSMITWLVASAFRLLRTTYSRVGLINTNIKKYYFIFTPCKFRILEGAPRTKDQNKVRALVVLASIQYVGHNHYNLEKIVEINIFYNLHQHFMHSYDL